MHTLFRIRSIGFTSFLAAALAALLLVGCASLSRVRFDVDPSALDYLTMACHIPQDPSRSAWLQLTGSGFLEVRRGSSQRVTDEMWAPPEQDNWNDYRANRIALNQQQTKDSFQWLVDAGFFDRNLKNSASTNEVYFAIAAQVGFKKQRAILTGDEYTALFSALYKTGTR